MASYMPKSTVTGDAYPVILAPMITPVRAMSDLLESLMRGREEPHGFCVRLAAAFWGSFVLHFAILVDSAIIFLSTPVVLNYYVVALVIGYSAVFASVVAVGVPRGTVISHFCLGVILPTFAYTLGGLLEVSPMASGG